jgi:tRNA threonylcarbamoyladenosine biosynthesis protein TsaB
MNILALETSTGANTIAVVAGLGASAERWCLRAEPRGVARAETVLSLVAAAMAEAGLSFGDLDLLAACTGPGSFTGIRSGLAAARGLALAAAKPLVGASAHDLMAAAFVAQRPAPGPFAVAIDAHKDEAYIATYDAAGRNVGPPQLMDAAAFAVAAPVFVIGPAAAMVGSWCGLPATAMVVLPLEPDAVTLARLAPTLPRDRKVGPLYIRPADAKAPAPSPFLPRRAP